MPDLDALHRMNWTRFSAEERSFFEEAGARVSKELGAYGFALERCTHVRMSRQDPITYLTFFMSPMVVLKEEITRSGIQIYIDSGELVIPGGAIGHSNEESPKYNYQTARFYERTPRSDEILTLVEQGLVRAGNLGRFADGAAPLPSWAADWSGGMQSKQGVLVIKVIEASSDEPNHTLLASPYDNDNDQLIVAFEPISGDVVAAEFWSHDPPTE